MSAAVFILALALTQAPSPPDSLERERVSGAVGAQLDSLLTRYGQLGFAGTVLVVRDRRIVLLKGYGLADFERGVRNSAATRYEMNSFTKMFTAPNPREWGMGNGEWGIGQLQRRERERESD